MSTAEMELTLTSWPQDPVDHPSWMPSEIPPCRAYFRGKVLLDLALAAILIIPTLPVIVLLVILVRLTSPGPGLLRQRRVGRRGTTFDMYKIRTMWADAEAKTGAVWTQTNDPRITPLGHVLRKCHLDELPQLVNVLLGEMSLVGPRPERPEFVDVLANEVTDYCHRLAVRPGITGLAQINLPPDTDLDSVRRKQILDLEYIHTAGLWLDFRMLLCTCLRLFGCSGQQAMQLMRLERTATLAGPAEDAPAAGDAPPRQTTGGTPVCGSGGTPAAAPADVAEAVRVRHAAGESGNGKPGATPDVAAAPEPATPTLLRRHSGAMVSANRALPPGTRRGQRAAEDCGATDGREPHALDLAGAFTVDVEDYYHVTAFEDDIPRDRWDEYPSRVVDNTRRILELLARHHVHGTFFVLGWVAQRHPGLVEEIFRAGHEIGSHGFWHQRICQQKPEEFRRDVQQSRDVLMEITGQKVTAYRAPCFSITQDSLWALPILAEEGFEVDCSIFPIRHDRYGIPSVERAVHRIATGAGLLWEFPPATRRLAGVNLPVSGGGYFRLLPARLTAGCLNAARRQTGRPFVFYIHPWELDPDQPRLPIGSWTSRRRHYLNLSSTEGKLDVLLQRFRFGRVQDLVDQLAPPTLCRFGSAEGTARPLEVFSAGHHEGNGNGNGNGRAAFRRASPCETCNPDSVRNGNCCPVPVFELTGQSLNPEGESRRV